MRNTLLFVPVTLLLLAAGMFAQTAKPAAQAPPRAAAPAAPAAPFKMKGSVKDVMDFIVIPSSQFLFDSVGSVEGPNGSVDKEPKTDADWEDVRKNAVLLAEGANLLMIAPRHAAGAKDKSANPGSELEPAQIDALITKNRAVFVKFAQGLMGAAELAFKAVDARSADQLSDAGGAIDTACENCHLTFWYPNEKK